MPAGSLRDRFRLLRRETRERNDLGEPVYVWTPYATVWGELGDATGTDGMSDAWTQPRRERRASLTLRFRDDVEPTDRVLEIRGGVTWEIDDVRDPDRRRERLKLELRQTT